MVIRGSHYGEDIDRGWSSGLDRWHLRASTHGVATQKTNTNSKPSFHVLYKALPSTVVVLHGGGEGG
jgi:hypothetical protein